MRCEPIAFICSRVPEVLNTLVTKFRHAKYHSPSGSKWKHKALVQSDDGRGWMIKSGSQRYRLFNNNRICVLCGREGVVLGVVPTYHPSGTTRYHLNLYAIEENLDLVLLTKDHVVPRSKGGPDKLSNYQTMCAPCNVRKGNKRC